MELDLHFPDLDQDLVEAVARVQVADLATAGEPSAGADSADVGPFTVAPSTGSVTVTVTAALPGLRRAYEAGLTVRVRARAGSGGQPVEYLNTTGTRVPEHPDGPVRVSLERIG